MTILQKIHLRNCTNISVTGQIMREIKDLLWHRAEFSIECVQGPPRTYRGHALEIVQALIKGASRNAGAKIAFHSVGRPLSRLSLHQGTLIPLTVQLVGVSDTLARAWSGGFVEYLNSRPESHFTVRHHSAPVQMSIADLRIPSASEEWRLDFLTPLPFFRAKGESRTALRAANFFGTLQRRMESLFAVKLPAIPDCTDLEVLPYYWHYEELRHVSRSQNQLEAGKAKKKGGAPHLQYFNGCTGPLFVRGELEPFSPWLALASALHAGGTLELNGLGHFSLSDKPEPWLDTFLGDETRLREAADSVLSRNDAAIEYARACGGTADPAALAGNLAEELSAGRYQPAPYDAFDVKKSSGVKRRVERLAPADMVAQQYLNEVLAKPFDNAFSSESMAFRRGVSREDATRRVRELIATGHRFVIRADVADFFPSINHARLLAALDRLLPRADLRTRAALARVIAAPVNFEGTVSSRTLGLAQGSPLSPLLANVYLDSFDRRLSEAGMGFVRYGDDVVILTRSTADSRTALAGVEAALDELGLRLNEEKTRISAVAAGFDFLGEHFDGSGETLPHKAVPSLRRPFVVTEPYLMLAVNGEALDVRRGAQLLNTVPLRQISEIVLLSMATFSTALIERCARHGIPLSIALTTGYQIGTFTPDSRAFHDVSWKQGHRYHGLTSRERTAIAGEIAAAKILNYTRIVQARYKEGDGSLLRDLEACAAAARGAAATDQIRGHEGYAARLVFAWLNRQVIDSKQRWFAGKRRERGGPDRVNSMLNFGYYLLFTRINGLVRACGLNPYWGFLHDTVEDFETLVCDIQELFRVHVDRLVLRLINRGEITQDHFETVKNNLRLSRAGIRKYTDGFETLFSEVHDGITLRDAIVLQVENFRQFLTDGRQLHLYRFNAEDTHDASRAGDADSQDAG